MAGRAGSKSAGKPARVAARKTARPKLPKSPWWKTALGAIGLLAWVLVSVFLSQIVIGNVMYAILGEKLNEPAWEAAFSAISYLLAMLLIIWVPPKVSVTWKITNKDKQSKGAATPQDVDRAGLGLKGWPTWTDIGLAPVGFVAYLLAAAALTALFSLFPWFDVEQVQEVGFSYSLVGVDRIWAFISLVVVAPIAEEIIFRGWLYGKLRQKFSHRMSNIGGMILAIFLVSALFGLVHLQWNVGVNVFCLSVAACLLREFTGTIYSGILLHMLKNGVAFYLLYVLGATG